MTALRTRQRVRASKPRPHARGRVPLRISDVRGLQSLASEATIGIVDIVEATHSNVLKLTGVVRPPKGRTGGITGFVYRSVRGIARLVGAAVDRTLAALESVVDDAHSSPQRDAALAALNGVLGDRLAASRSPLAIPMAIHADGRPLVLDAAALATRLPQPRAHLLVLAHGLCMNHRHWSREGHDHGAALAAELGAIPLYVEYNSGLPVAVNGEALADRLDALLRAWPHPVERLTLLGHSMGGLVLRSACDHASRAGHGWLGRVDTMIFLGTPHLGASLERAGTCVDALLEAVPLLAPFARIGRIRSAGIRDLGHGLMREDHRPHPSGRRQRSPLPLPAGIRCFTLAASRDAAPAAGHRRVAGDGLVSVGSALGRSADGTRDLHFAAAQRAILFRTDHFALLGATAYPCIRAWAAGERSAPRR